MQKFQLKFIDIMVGVVLGLGFQWWADLRELWQYIAFIFAYLTVIDYWVDYNPIANKYALKLEIDVLIHTLIIFGMFLLLFSPLKNLAYFFYSFAFYRLADILWLWRIKSHHTIPKNDLKFMNTWQIYDWVEAVTAVLMATISAQYSFNPVYILLVFIFIRAITRILSSLRYQKAFFAF